MDKTILLIEDDPVLVKMYLRKFEKDGFKVETAMDGQTAIDMVARLMPNIILLDIMLPRVDGLEVLRVIKENPKTKDIPVVLSTNLGGDELDREKGIKMGAVDYLVKSEVTPAQIVAKIKSYIK